jgi:trimeric autotransporter adhesin
MKPSPISVVMLVVSLFLAPAVLAQSPDSANQGAASPAPSAAAADVPRLIKFSGTLLDALDRPLAGPVGVTFALYKEQERGAALWMETQNVTPDVHGLYTVLLGANSAHGVPAELFASGEARWLEVQVERQAEQPRVLLVSVPYALKAADADTLGGKPLSAFLTTGQAAGGSASGKSSASAGVVVPAVSGTGSTNVVAKWVDNLGTLGNSQMTDDGTNVSIAGNASALTYKFTGNAALPTDATATILNAANIGPVFSGLSFKVRTGAPAPADALTVDANHNVSIAGNASALTYKFTGNAALPTDATATILNAANVGPVFSGFSFSVRTGSPPADALTVDSNQRVGIGTTAASQRLEVGGNIKLNGSGNAIIFSDGTMMSTATAGTGGGTITGVTAGTGLSGGGTTGGISLGINPAVVPELAATSNTFTGSITANSFNGSGAGLSSVNAVALNGLASTAFATVGANSFTGNQSITGNLGVSGLLSLPATANASTGVITLGGFPFVHNFASNNALHNTFVGQSAGNFTMTGDSNTATGFLALQNNTTGNFNTAIGGGALSSNTTGEANIAIGAGALTSNTTANGNIAIGLEALQLNTGSENTGIGDIALRDNTFGSGNTASGAVALLSNTTGSNNTASGASALQSNTTGSNNTAIGSSAGFAATANTTGSNNTFIGTASGQGTSTQQTNATAIGAHALVNCSNCVVLGDSTMPMSVGIRTNSPGQALSVAGTIQSTTGGFMFPDSTVQTTASLGGSVSSVGSGLGLTGGPITGSGTLAINPTVVPQLGAKSNTFAGSITANSFTGSGTGLSNVNAAMLNGLASTAFATVGANSFTGNESVTGNVSLTGNLGLPNTTSGTVGVITLGGTPFAHNFGPANAANTFIGLGAGNFNMTGVLNSAFGLGALSSNTDGFDNSSFGVDALLTNASGFDNSAFGVNALSSNTTGQDNSAFGSSALDGLTSGNFNIAIGVAAGTNLVGSESNNIYIGNAGVASESNKIRIGNTDISNGPVQTAAFVAGISGVNVSGAPVLVSSSGQLGVAVSSRRFKDDIADMGSESDLLMKLRPVAFYYKPELDPAHTRQYGLVAEEVAQVSPELVIFDKDGAPQTVRYHFVNAMLLNEVQKQRQLVEEQQSTITRQKAEIQDLAARLAKLEALVSPVR